MTSVAFGVVLYILSLIGKGKSCPTVQVYPPSSPPVPPPPPQPAQWPVAVPSNVPPFGDGWEPDVPPPPEVFARANALDASGFTDKGFGTTVQEMTGGRWITYRAETAPPEARAAGYPKALWVMPYRLNDGIAQQLGLPSQQAAAVPSQPVTPLAPQALPGATTPLDAGGGVTVGPIFQVPPPGTIAPTTDTQTTLNTLGFGPLVVDGQPATLDGTHPESLTQQAVARYQQARGLAVDGVPGPNTIVSMWTDLAALGQQAAPGTPGNPVPLG